MEKTLFITQTQRDIPIHCPKCGFEIAKSIAYVKMTDGSIMQGTSEGHSCPSCHNFIVIYK